MESLPRHCRQLYSVNEQFTLFCEFYSTDQVLGEIVADFMVLGETSRIELIY